MQGVWPPHGCHERTMTQPIHVRKIKPKSIKNPSNSIFWKSFLIISLHVQENSPGRPEACDAPKEVHGALWSGEKIMQSSIEIIKNPSKIHRKNRKNHQKINFSKSFLVVSLHLLAYSPGRPEASQASGRPGEYSRTCRETIRKDFEKIDF